MKTTLTCDDIFEALTSGPIVCGSAEATAVQDHVVDCNSCKQLAEALRPACHLIHEALPEEMCGDLPVYLPDKEAVSRVMSRIDALPIVQTPRFDLRQTALGLCAAVAVILLLLWRQLPAEDTDKLSVSLFALETMKLPQACLSSFPLGQSPIGKIGGDSSQETTTYACCTSCHASSLETSPRVDDLALLVAACNSCH